MNGVTINDDVILGQEYEIKIVKYIPDAVYETEIGITRREVELLMTSHLQRLHYVRQPSFGLERVFPQSTESRFAHSLGVMFLTDKVYEGLINSTDEITIKILKTIIEAIKGELEKRIDNAPSIREHLRAAAIVHDIGHLPLSHSLERQMHFMLLENIMRRAPTVGEPLQEELYELFEKLRGVPLHEVTGFFIVINPQSKFHEKLKELGYDPGLVALLAFDDVRQKVHLINELKDITFINELKERWLTRKEALKGISVLGDLISGDFGTDRLDYILREIYNSGAPLGGRPTYKDIETLFLHLGLCICVQDDEELRVCREVPDDFLKEDRYEIKLYSLGRSDAAIEGISYARDRLWKWLYINHKACLFERALQVLFERLIELKCLDELKNEFLRRALNFCLGMGEDYEVFFFNDSAIFEFIYRAIERLSEEDRDKLRPLIALLVKREPTYIPLWKRIHDLLLRGVEVETMEYLGKKADEAAYNLKDVHDINLYLERELKSRLTGWSSRCNNKEDILVIYKRYAPSLELYFKARERRRGSIVELLKPYTEVYPSLRALEEAAGRFPRVFVYMIKGSRIDLKKAILELQSIIRELTTTIVDPSIAL